MGVKGNKGPTHHMGIQTMTHGTFIRFLVSFTVTFFFLSLVYHRSGIDSSEYNHNQSSDAHLAQAQQQQHAINSHLITEQEKILSQDLMSSVKGLENEEEQLQKSIQNQMANVQKQPPPPPQQPLQNQMTSSQQQSQQQQQQQYVDEQKKIQSGTPFQNQVENGNIQEQQQQQQIPNQINNNIQEREKIEIFSSDQMRKSVDIDKLMQGESDKYRTPLFYNRQPDEQETPPQQSSQADQRLNPMEQTIDLNDEAGMPNLDNANNNNNNELPTDEFEIISGSVTTLAEPTDGMDGGDDVPFYHCGPAFGRMAKDADSYADRKEVLLLHGAKYSKEEWRGSGILENLCRRDDEREHAAAAGGTTAMSVTAIDIGLQWNGINLLQALRGLWSEGIISGDPLIIVTPSMSGKTILSAAEIDIKTGESEREDTLLGKMLKAWVPVASGSAMKVREETLRLFEMDRLPILAINGEDDKMGRKVGRRMKELAGAATLEIAGGHACYLDSPDVFVENLIRFVDQVTHDEFSN